MQNILVFHAKILNTLVCRDFEYDPNHIQPWKKAAIFSLTNLSYKYLEHEKDF